MRVADNCPLLFFTLSRGARSCPSSKGGRKYEEDVWRGQGHDNRCHLLLSVEEFSRGTRVERCALATKKQIEVSVWLRTSKPGDKAGFYLLNLFVVPAAPSFRVYLDARKEPVFAVILPFYDA